VVVITVLAILWAFSRDINALFVVLAAIVALFVIVGAPRKLATAVGLMAVLLGAGVAIGFTVHDNRMSVSFDDVVADRILTSPARSTYFFEHGMPSTVQGMRSTYVGPVPATDPWFTDPGLASYRQWAASEGPSTYGLYLFTHLPWAASTPLHDPETLNGPVVSPPLSSYGSTGYRSLLPTSVQHILFTQGNSDLFLEASLAFLLAVIALWKARWDYRNGLIGLGVAIFAALYCITAWLTNGIEVGRHALFGVVGLRVALVIVAGSAIVSLVEARSSASTPDQEEPA
jgi:hypothetical protein